MARETGTSGIAARGANRQDAGSCRRNTGRCCFAAVWNSLDSLTHVLPREVEFVGALKVHPEVGGHAEISAESQGCVDRDIPPYGQQLKETVWRHLDQVGESFRREPISSSSSASISPGVNRCARHLPFFDYREPSEPIQLSHQLARMIHTEFRYQGP